MKQKKLLFMKSLSSNWIASTDCFNTAKFIKLKRYELKISNLKTISFTKIKYNIIVY